MVCTVTDVTKEYLPKKNIAKTASPHSYHEFNIESNLAEDNTNIEIPLKEKKDKTLEESIKSTECEESTISTDCQIQINDENNMQIEHTNSIDESEDSKSIPSDWENVRIKVERLSDENTESREIKKKKKQKKVMSSSDSSSSTSSSDSEKEKKRKKRKRKILSNSSSSDSDSTDSSSSSSSDSSSSDEKRKRRRKKKTVGKKKKKAKRARTKKKRRRKMITDSSSSDSDQPDQRIKKKKKVKKKKKEAKSINNGDISKIISKSPASSSGETKILHSETSIKKVKEETMVKNKKITDEITSTRKTITSMNVHDNECMKQWEVDSMITLQSNDGESSQDHTGELGKIDGSEKSTHRRKRKRSRDMQDKDRSSKEKIQEGKERSDEELDVKRKKRREKDIRSSTEFLADWEREGERINQQIIQNEVKFSKKLEKKQKKEKWGETDFDTLNVPSLTQLEKEVCQKQLLADEWEVDSLEAIAITDLTVSKRKSNQSILKKMEKEVRYDEKTDTYIAIEKESAKEMKKRQERLCAIRIWEEEQEEGEKEEMMLLKQKNKHKKDDWDIEEESFLCKNNEEIEICNDIVGIEKEWIKSSDDTSVKEDSNKEIKLESIGSKRVRKSRWDMGSHSEEKSETKDIWEEEYPEWSKINKYEQKHEETEKEDSHIATYSENSNKERSVKSDLIDFYHKKSQNRESLERTWTAEEMATRPMQTKNVEDTSVKNLISVKTSNEQIVSTKEHQARDQFKEMLDLKKLTEKTIELYSPSSPALSQKSQVSIFICI